MDRELRQRETRCVDYAVKVRINASQTGVETAGVKHSMVRTVCLLDIKADPYAQNPFDEIGTAIQDVQYSRAALMPR